ncbi:MAG: type II 3-dehydroquinate dehydratase [Cellvibrionales bacterium]|nr:type II 3-dehydroquinate dehydratase [Cellvibrionales bacterium]
MATILVLQGPNLNLLGTREPAVYGRETLAQIHADLTRRATECGHRLTHLQSNAEHALIERIQQAGSGAGQADFILFNPGAFTHSSIALRDALAAVAIPFIEVHISNPYRREPFRHKSYFSDLAVAVICGFGTAGYRHALEHAIAQLAAAP